MPLHKTILTHFNTQIYIWKITETETDLLQNMVLSNNSKMRLNEMKAESHRKGFLAIRQILLHLNLADADLVYNQDGKPHLSNGKEVSISHSFDFSVLAISDNKIGLDIELCRDKVTKLAYRFCTEHFIPEHYNSEQRNQMYTVIWGTKEVVFKIENHKGISFKDHIFAEPFDLNSEQLAVSLNFYENKKKYQLGFDLVDNYVLVWGWEI